MFHAQSPSQDKPADEAITAVSSIAYGFMGSQALFAALDLGLFTVLMSGPMTAEALAKKTGAKLDPLRSLLEACTAVNLLAREGASYRNSPAAARYLVRGARGYMGDYYLQQIAETLYQQLPDARAVLRGAQPATYARFLDDPKRTEAFIRGQHAGSSGPAFLLARNADLSGYSCLLDLGGGSGAFSIEAVKRWPNLSAIVFDQPQVIAFAEKFVAEAGLSGRIRCVSGDVVAGEWPADGDLILLSYIISSYQPGALRDLLDRAFGYLPSRGGVIIHDFAMNDDAPGPRNAALWCFANLAISASTYPHRVSEVSSALRAAGFVDIAAGPHIPDITFVFSGRRP